MGLYTNREEQQSSISLSSEDRRVLLDASLRLLTRRCRCGQPIFADDLVRLTSLVDVATARPGSENQVAKSFKLENCGKNILSRSAEAGDE
jgi:hypothetical protein